MTELAVPASRHVKRQVETGYLRVLNDGEAELVLWCDGLGGGVGVG